jgi:shikimate kinase
MIDTIIFIGMAGVGKSSIGKIAASHYGCPFFDTDKLISDRYSLSIPKMITEQGIAAFHKIESNEVLKHVGNNAIISPGGSFIYATNVIEKLKERTLFIYLHDTPHNIKNRIPNLEARGITGLDKKSFEDVFYEREPLYKAAATVTFSCENKSFKAITSEVIEYLSLIYNSAH